MLESKEISPFLYREPTDTALVKTQSRLRVWWLCRFHGFRVVSISQLPIDTIAGGIRYSRTWWLSPRNGKDIPRRGR
jgi:hypothetical protein